MKIQNNTHTHTGIYCVYSLIPHSKIIWVHSPVYECMCLQKVCEMEIAGGEHIKLHSSVSLKQANKKKGRRKKDKKKNGLIKRKYACYSNRRKCRKYNFIHYIEKIINTRINPWTRNRGDMAK